MLFVDSNVFIAFYNTADNLHLRAKQLVLRLEHEKELILINDYVFAEVVTVLSLRVSKQVAVIAGRELLTHPHVTVLHTDVGLQKHAWEIFAQTKTKNTSFTDCSILASLQSEEVSFLASFDETDFKTHQTKFRFKLIGK